MQRDEKIAGIVSVEDESARRKNFATKKEKKRVNTRANVKKGRLEPMHRISKRETT